jgi:hypothetical protein
VRLLLVLFLFGVTVPSQAQEKVSKSSGSLSGRWATLVQRFYPDLELTAIPRKCGTPFLVPATLSWDGLSSMTKQELLPAFARPVRQKSRVSPSGRFRVHYDTTGVESPALLDPSHQRIPNTHEAYVDSVVYYLEFVWKMLIDSRGYGTPYPDGMEGGGPEYDVYLGDLGFGFSGITSWDPAQPIGNGANKRYATFTELDNDFRDVRTKGMDGLKITIAHEFFHAIQLGSYGIWTNVRNSDFYFYELTAVWVEDELFDDVNDYYFDLPQYFQQFRDIQNRSFSFTTFNLIYPGYERSLWAHYLVKRFGKDVLRATWELMRSEPFLPSMDRALYTWGTNLADEYAQFTQWNCFTGYRADTVRFYPEGRNYPLLRPNAEMGMDGFSGVSVQAEAYPLSSQTYQFAGATDTLLAVVANVDLTRARENRDALAVLRLQLSASRPFVPYQVLSQGLYAGFSVIEPSQWRVVHLHLNQKTDAKRLAELFPNPLRLSETTRLTLPVTTSCADATVYFFSSSMDLLFSRSYSVMEYLGKQFVSVPVGDLRDKIGSGVCFVILECAETKQQWKVAVIR